MHLACKISQFQPEQRQSRLGKKLNPIRPADETAPRSAEIPECRPARQMQTGPNGLTEIDSVV